MKLDVSWCINILSSSFYNGMLQNADLSREGHGLAYSSAMINILISLYIGLNITLVKKIRMLKAKLQDRSVATQLIW